MKETEYWHRTDTFEQKLELLKAASERRDFRLARALVESLKNTLVFAQQEEESLGTPLLRADAFARVAELPTFVAGMGARLALLQGAGAGRDRCPRPGRRANRTRCGIPRGPNRIAGTRGTRSPHRFCERRTARGPMPGFK